MSVDYYAQQRERDASWTIELGLEVARRLAEKDVEIQTKLQQYQHESRKLSVLRQHLRDKHGESADAIIQQARQEGRW